MFARPAGGGHNGVIPHVSAILACVSLMALGAACGGTQTESDTTVEAVDPATPPGEEEIAHAGETIYAAIVAGSVSSLLVDEAEMRALVDAEAGERYAALRLAVASRIGQIEAHAFEGTEYSGVCLQGAHLEPAADRLGLRESAWTFDRALIVAAMGGGRRVAAWVEGVFVRTPQGFVALDIHSVEDPRWEHSDLEIASCDMEVGMRHPQDIGMVTP